jgi:hypothetical protein
LTLTDVPEFPEVLKVVETSGEDVKPVVILLVDGGPDANLRYLKTLRTAIGHFKRNNFDSIFITYHAPGQSALNAARCRMAPLSHDVSRLILLKGFDPETAYPELPFDYYCSSVLF